MKVTIQNNGAKSSILFLTEDSAFTGVRKIASRVRRDIEKVTGSYPAETSITSDGSSNSGKWQSMADGREEAVIFYGTLGKSRCLEQLASQKIIDVSKVRGKWETYGFWIVENPFSGSAGNALIIAGSDKRGTIYGLLHLSELMGVSPLTDWADVWPEKKNHITLTERDSFISKEPSVKYRGIFINDEWPAFGSWAEKRFGGLNARMYENVFELILRLKGNYLWPAMWHSSFSEDGPGLENAVLADEYGIVMGTSHHEPCMRAGEEYGKVREKNSVYGDAWNFRSNQAGVTRFWEDGLKRNKSFENIITVGMRGENDTAIMGTDTTLEENIQLLKDVIKVQNQLIKENINPDLEQVPRLFVIFTEVARFYYGEASCKGLWDSEVLDGVTLMLTDDNFGNLRSMPTEEIRNHKGGFGLYYHLDFHGGAYAYDWMNTNYLPKMWEQLTNAYDFGIQDVWIANIGDIALLEYPLCYFMDLAYDMDRYGLADRNGTDRYTTTWLKSQFGHAFSPEDLWGLKRILDDYSLTNHNRKPEIMNVDVYHPVHFGEAKQLLLRLNTVEETAEELREKCPEELLPAYYDLIYYPGVASANLHKMWLYAMWNDFYAKQGRLSANEMADRVEACILRDKELTKEYHSVGNGKWFGMGQSEHIGFINWCEEDCKYPRIIRICPANKPRLLISIEDQEEYVIGTNWTKKNLYSDHFMQQSIDAFCIELSPGSDGKIEFFLSTDCNWLILSQVDGVVERETKRVMVTVDRTKFTGTVKGEIVIWTEFSRVTIEIKAQNRDDQEWDSMMFIEERGYLSMEAEHYYESGGVEGTEFCLLKPFGRTCSGMKVLPPLASDLSGNSEWPYLGYCFVAKETGDYDLLLYLAPSNPPYADNRFIYGIQMNGGSIDLYNVVEANYESIFNEGWVEAVRNNIRLCREKVKCQKGKNLLRFYAISPSLVLEKLVLHNAAEILPQSYMGPPESDCVSVNTL